MPNYVQLNDASLVVAVTETDGVIDAAHMIEIAEYDTSLLGKKYENGVFVDGPITILPSIITKLALLNRMTDAEFSGILAAVKTDTDVEAWKTRFDVAINIDLDNDRTKSGFDMLVTKTLLTQERATAILTNPVQPNER